MKYCNSKTHNFLSTIRLLRILCITVLIITTRFTVFGQAKNYSIDVSKISSAQTVPLEKMGGSNSDGEKIAVNNFYITKGGSPVIPIMGEMHFTRYPNEYWDESIKKMKADGINIIATYVFWNIHEEKEGKFIWDGDRDLRKFVDLCKKNNMGVVVRVGPFDHGEIRNGGLPDWLLGKPLTIRSNDSLYLHYVGLLYDQIGKQLKGLYYKNGGPIIGIQLENEYQHSASPWGLTYPGQPYDLTVADRDLNSAHEGVSVASSKNAYAEQGNEHMRKLKTLAIKAGMIAPLYTATGWGYAAGIPGETLPVTAAYAYPTWTEKKEFSSFFLYSDMHAHPDYSPVRYNPMDYPAFAAELGSGIMTTYSRRPIVPAESVDALINRVLGSGANGIGYYMFHGGSTPAGEHYFFNDEAYAYPKISYDFQAPIGEYGQVRPSFSRLKLIHFFLNDFQALLAPMVSTLPGNAGDLKPNDISSLRYAVRSDGAKGFLFINNFQNDTAMTDKKDIHISVITKNGKVDFSERGGLNLKSGENVILPFNLGINGNNLIYATAQLLTKSDDANKPYFVFFSPEGVDPQFCFDKSLLTVSGMVNCKTETSNNKVWVKCSPTGPSLFSIAGKDGKKTVILSISKKLALRSYQQEIDGSRHLLFSDAVAISDNNNIELLSSGNNEYSISVFPKLNGSPKIDRGNITAQIDDKIFSKFEVTLPKVELIPETVKTGIHKITVQLPKSLPAGLNDLYLNIDYVGDTGMGFLGGELVTDEFYKGIPWQIGLRRFINMNTDGQFGFYFRPLMRNASYMVDLPASIAEMAEKNKQTLQINHLSYTPEYKSIITFK